MRGGSSSITFPDEGFSLVRESRDEVPSVAPGYAFAGGHPQGLPEDPFTCRGRGGRGEGGEGTLNVLRKSRPVCLTEVAIQPARAGL